MTERARAEATTRPTDDEIEEALAFMEYFRRMHAWWHEVAVDHADQFLAHGHVDGNDGPRPEAGQRQPERSEAPPIYRCSTCDASFVWTQTWLPDGPVYCPRCYARRLRR